jgi:diguanylate cyclase (GGDEF)-like protein
MKNIQSYRHSQAKWVRKVLNAYWTIVAIQLIAQLATLFFLDGYKNSVSSFIQNLIVYPTLILCAAAAFSEWMRRYPKLILYSLSFTGTIISSVIVITNGDVRIIAASFMLGIVAATVFFQIRLLLFTLVLQILGFFITFFLDHADFYKTMTAFDMVAALCFFVAVTMICIAVTKRGQGLLDDIQEYSESHRRLELRHKIASRLARTDALTNMNNHRSFQEEYEEAIQRAGDHQATLYLALIDIDDFKTVNDTYGHRTGDLILARIGETIRSSMIDGDVAARYGGEEFAVLMFRASSDEALAAAERIRIRIAELEHPETDRRMTVSIGLKAFEGESREQLFEAADALMYEAKRQGKNCSVFKRKSA